ATPPNTSAALSASILKMLARLMRVEGRSASPRKASARTRLAACNAPARAMTRSSLMSHRLIAASLQAMLCGEPSGRRIRGFDDTAAEALVAAIEDDGLARRDGALRRIEADLAGVAVEQNLAALVILAVARLGDAAELGAGRRAGDPGQFAGDQARGVQP